MNIGIGQGGFDFVAAKSVEVSVSGCPFGQIVFAIENASAVNFYPDLIGSIMRFAIAGQMEINAFAQLGSDKRLDSRF